MPYLKDMHINKIKTKESIHKLSTVTDFKKVRRC